MQIALQEELENYQRKSRESQSEVDTITGRITQAKNIHSKSAHALQMIRNEIKVLSKKKLALKAEEDERREAGCIDTTNLEREEVRVKRIYISIIVEFIITRFNLFHLFIPYCVPHNTSSDHTTPHHITHLSHQKTH